MKNIYSFFFLTCAILTSPIPSSAQNSSFQNQDELKNIDQEIETLKKDLETLRENALNREMQAQPYMFDNWHEFAENIRDSEENEKKILMIKKKIKELNERKQTL